MYQNLNVALIPLRGGSKGIVKKNIKPMVGKLLCAWVLEVATNARYIIKYMFQPTAQRLETLQWVLCKLNKPYQKCIKKINKRTR